MVVSTGAEVTVTVADPDTEPDVAVTVVVPAATAVNAPVAALIVPIDGALDVHANVAVNGAPF